MITLSFPEPAERLNANRKMHWTKKAELVRAWRQAACVHAKNAKIRDLGPSIITLHFHTSQNRRRDPGNWYPTVKATVDGLTDAKLWPDDNSDWVLTTESIFHYVGKDSPLLGTVIVEITPWEGP